MKPTVKEVSKKFDLGFDYANLIRFKNEEELKKEYGEEFFNHVREQFYVEWSEILNLGLEIAVQEGRGISESLSHSIRYSFKSLGIEHEDSDDLQCFWNDGEDDEVNGFSGTHEIVPEIPEPKVTEYFRPKWNSWCGSRNLVDQVFVVKEETHAK